jgi:hypothetical protein
MQLVEQLLGEKPRAVVWPAALLFLIMSRMAFGEQPREDVANVRQQDGVDIAFGVFLVLPLAER